MIKKHLTTFDSEALYNAFVMSDAFVKPNVSFVKELAQFIFNKRNGEPVGPTGQEEPIDPTGEPEPTGQEEPVAAFTINGDPYTDKVITLAPGGTYELSGIHEGQIIIDAKTIKPNAWTTVILNNAAIISDESYGILYDCPESNNKGYQGLYVTLVKDSQNFVVCNKTNTVEGDETFASIDSWKDLTVQGVGYLAVYNNIAHGLRGEVLNVAGPHIYVDVQHDGIHGDDVKLLDGVFYLQNAKDGIGTTPSGKIGVLGGSFTFVNVAQDRFDAKDYGYFIDTKYNYLSTNYNTFSNIKDLTIDGTVTAYPTKADYDAKTNGVVIEQTTTAMKEIILYNADENGNVVASATAAGYTVPVVQTDSTTGEDVILIGSTSMYVINKNYNVVEVSGKISAPIVRPMDAITISEPTFSKKGKLNGGYDNSFDVYLNGAIITTNADSPSIANLPDAGRVKIIAVKDTVNAIINKKASGVYDLDAVKSENNVILEAKNGSVLYINSAGGDGVDGGDMKITDSKGAIIITGCAERGIKGTYTVIGPNADIPSGIINPVTDTESPDYTTFDGILIVKDNCKVKEEGLAVATAEDPEMKQTGFADIYGRNGKHSKGKVLFTNNELKGVVIVGSIGARDNIDLGAADNLYVKRILLDAVHPVDVTQELYKAVPYNEDPIV